MKRSSWPPRWRSGPEGNLLEPDPESAHQLELPSPVLSNEELEKIRNLSTGDPHGFKTITLPIVYRVADGGAGLRKAIEQLRDRCSEAIAEGHNIIILSDRGHDADEAPIPALLAVSAVHHHLVRSGTRTLVGLVLESGEPREVHHFALLHRLRRERHQPVPRLRDRPRPGPPRA